MRVCVKGEETTQFFDCSGISVEEDGLRLESSNDSYKSWHYYYKNISRSDAEDRIANALVSNGFAAFDYTELDCSEHGLPS